MILSTPVLLASATARGRALCKTGELDHMKSYERINMATGVCAANKQQHMNQGRIQVINVRAELMNIY